MRGLGVNWMEVLYFSVVIGGVVATGYFALHFARRR